MGEEEKAFVTAAIKIRIKNEEKEAKKVRAKQGKKGR